MNTLAENFRCLLEESGKTHRELAEILQINVHDIIRWESARTIICRRWKNC